MLRFQEHFGRLTGEIEGLKRRELADMAAKAMIHDVFAGGVMPLRLLPEVSTGYFEPRVPVCEARTAWSLHNAFTGAAKSMPMTTRLPAIQAVGKMFGMTTSEDPTEDAGDMRE